MMKLSDIQSDNRGLTLVELLVTIAVSAVLAAAVSIMIGYSVNTYQNESVNTALQTELQTNVNQVMDAIMGSSGAVIKQKNATVTEYAGFGKFKETRDPSSGAVTNVVFDGTVLVSGTNGEIYLARGTESGSTAIVAVEEVVKKITGEGVDKRPYLLGQNATVFKIEADAGCVDESTRTYTNPLTVKVWLEFERIAGGGQTITKTVKDNAVMRNKVTADIYLGTEKYVLAK